MNEPVKTFSIGFEGDAAYDETAMRARSVAARFDTDHTEFRVTPSAVDLIDRLIWHHDGPFGDSSAIPTYLVSQLTRQHVTVVLTGDGGDELFAGYLRFRAALAAERLPRVAGAAALRALLAPLPARAQRTALLARARRFAPFMDLPLLERLTRWNSLSSRTIWTVCSSPTSRAAGSVDPLRTSTALDELARLSPLSRLLRGELRARTCPDDLLVKTDRCTMANSLEARCAVSRHGADRVRRHAAGQLEAATAAGPRRSSATRSPT